MLTARNDPDCGRRAEHRRRRRSDQRRDDYGARRPGAAAWPTGPLRRAIPGRRAAAEPAGPVMGPVGSAVASGGPALPRSPQRLGNRLAVDRVRPARRWMRDNHAGRR